MQSKDDNYCAHTPRLSQMDISESYIDNPVKNINHLANIQKPYLETFSRKGTTAVATSGHMTMRPSSNTYDLENQNERANYTKPSENGKKQSHHMKSMSNVNFTKPSKKKNYFTYRQDQVKEQRNGKKWSINGQPEGSHFKLY